MENLHCFYWLGFVDMDGNDLYSVDEIDLGFKGALDSLAEADEEANKITSQLVSNPDSFGDPDIAGVRIVRVPDPEWDPDNGPEAQEYWEKQQIKLGPVMTKYAIKVNKELEKDVKEFNDPVFKYRIVLDWCTPTRERRPTTAEDIINDIEIIEGSGTLRDLTQKLDYEYFYDPKSGEEYYFDDDDDYNYIISKYSIEDILEELLSDWQDPGDGTPNVFYIAINGKEIPDCGNVYYDMDKNLLAHGTKDDILKDMFKNLEFYDDEYFEDDDEYYEDDDTDDEDFY